MPRRCARASRPRSRRTCSTCSTPSTIDRPIVGGYDWGGRASCIVAAVHPTRVGGLVTVGGYNVFGAALRAGAAPPEWERTYWYQYYFHSERGRRGLERYRDELCELLWTTWSPEWSGAACRLRGERTEPRQPRLRRRGDPLLPAALRARPRRSALRRPRGGRSPPSRRSRCRPSCSRAAPTASADRAATDDREKFTGRYAFRELPGIGHDLPQEAPREFAEAVLSLRA